jgi:hypothetical protein
MNDAYPAETLERLKALREASPEPQEPSLKETALTELEHFAVSKNSPNYQLYSFICDSLRLHFLAAATNISNPLLRAKKELTDTHLDEIIEQCHQAKELEKVYAQADEIYSSKGYKAQLISLFNTIYDDYKHIKKPVTKANGSVRNKRNTLKRSIKELNDGRWFVFESYFGFLDDAIRNPHINATKKAAYSEQINSLRAAYNTIFAETAKELSGQKS